MRWGVGAALVLVLAGSAQAGRRPFIWPYDTEVVPARTVEIEQWVWDKHKPGEGLASVWWAPVIGVTENVELAFPIEIFWHQQPRDELAIETYGIDLRWRLPALADGKLVPLVRAGLKRLTKADLVRFEADLVVSLDVGPVHFVADPGITATSDGGEVQLTINAGVAVTLSNHVKIAAEVFAPVVLNTRIDDRTFVMVGPDVAFTFPRGWITIGLLIGVSEHAPVVMPRLIWAVAF